jgi:hypothetical protein
MIEIFTILSVVLIVLFVCKVAGRVFAEEYNKGVKDGITEFAKNLTELDLYIDIMVSDQGGTKEIRFYQKKNKGTEYREDTLRK